MLSASCVIGSILPDHWFYIPPTSWAAYRPGACAWSMTQPEGRDKQTKKAKNKTIRLQVSLASMISVILGYRLRPRPRRRLRAAQALHSTRPADVSGKLV